MTEGRPNRNRMLNNFLTQSFRGVRRRNVSQHPLRRAGIFWAAIFAACVFGNVLTAGPAPGDLLQIPLDQFLRQVEASYHGVRALGADFIQTYTARADSRTESGTVIFARGGRMRWDYRQPEPKLFLSDGKDVLFYLPGQNQLQRSPLKASEDYRIPFRLLLTRLDLRKYFSKIDDANEAFRHSPRDRVLRGIPKGGERAGYQQVLMEFDPQLNIRRLVIIYTDNSRMDFRFANIERNPRVAPSAFEFTPPPGTEIIKQQ